MVEIFNCPFFYLVNRFFKYKYASSYDAMQQQWFRQQSCDTMLCINTMVKNKLILSTQYLYTVSDSIDTLC
jgi:hypothetical protein